jgi:hypothetical protein
MADLATQLLLLPTRAVAGEIDYVLLGNLRYVFFFADTNNRLEQAVSQLIRPRFLSRDGMGIWLDRHGTMRGIELEQRDDLTALPLVLTRQLVAEVF